MLDFSIVKPGERTLTGRIASASSPVSCYSAAGQHFSTGDWHDWAFAVLAYHGSTLLLSSMPFLTLPGSWPTHDAVPNIFPVLLLRLCPSLAELGQDPTGA